MRRGGGVGGGGPEPSVWTQPLAPSSCRILKDYSHIRCRKHPQQSSVTTVVKSHHWGVRYAPAPSDIIW